ncbi:MAG: aminotransferase class I/II-fold pyridoxal phosphate-dependent enzyme [Planctomycetes bacterium]|nr:aminotransferase class I/II-fold pyridoxal phosphate-dependent enzyme [Planctomycetota bacterium]
MPRPAARTNGFGESVIREMTRLATAHNAINLAQGFPDFPTPAALKQAAIAAIEGDRNQYATTWGLAETRAAVAAWYERRYGMAVDPEREVTITCGSSEALVSAILATVDPGGRVVAFEPFYENYGPAAVIAGAETRLVRLAWPDWRLDPDSLRAAFAGQGGPGDPSALGGPGGSSAPGGPGGSSAPGGPGGSSARAGAAQAVIVNTPNNPTGKIFTAGELDLIAACCREHDAIAITDEIYETLTYDGATHLPLATRPGMRDRTITISSCSKTFAVTGWRVGWAVAPPALTDAIRKIHDYLVVCSPAPFQAAAVTALHFDDSYHEAQRAEYAVRRRILCDGLESAGFRIAERPRGSYYVLADIRPKAGDDRAEDSAFVRRMITEAGVAAVPGSSFHHPPGDGAHLIRFCFCKRRETLERAVERLEAWGG